MAVGPLSGLRFFSVMYNFVAVFTPASFFRVKCLQNNGFQINAIEAKK